MDAGQGLVRLELVRRGLLLHSFGRSDQPPAWRPRHPGSTSAIQNWARVTAICGPAKRLLYVRKHAKLDGTVLHRCPTVLDPTLTHPRFLPAQVCIRDTPGFPKGIQQLRGG